MKRFTTTLLGLLAASLLKWVTWAWGAFSAGGAWPQKVVAVAVEEPRAEG